MSNDNNNTITREVDKCISTYNEVFESMSERNNKLLKTTKSQHEMIKSQHNMIKLQDKIINTQNIKIKFLYVADVISIILFTIIWTLFHI